MGNEKGKREGYTQEFALESTCTQIPLLFKPNKNGDFVLWGSKTKKDQWLIPSIGKIMGSRRASLFAMGLRRCLREGQIDTCHVGSNLGLLYAS